VWSCPDALIIPIAELSMRRCAFTRRLFYGLFLIAACAIGSQPREARAFHGHQGGCHGGFGFGHGGFGPGGFGQCGFGGWRGGGFGCGGNWGGYGWGVPCWPVIGNVSYGTGFAFGGTRFWSGTTVFGVPAFGGCGPVWGAPAWGGCGPAWCAPVWGGCGPVWGAPAWCAPVWGGGWGGPGWIGGGWGGARFGGVGAWYGGWSRGPAWGWNRGPARGWNRGPAPGWAIPFAGAAPIGRLPVGRGHLGAPAIDAAVEVAIRTSNAPARARAARLVALGDRHLRAAVDEPAKLAKAIDAYRRAASIAPDQPDTFLRQAIAFTAAGKGTAAAAALGRAVAIDPRLAEGGRGKGVGIGGAFVGRAPADAVPPLAARSSKLLTRIFADSTATPEAPAENWIANRWLGRDAGPVMVAVSP
jgi:hypothetical protein